jgi:hypothetical protein
MPTDPSSTLYGTDTLSQYGAVPPSNIPAGYNGPLVFNSAGQLVPATSVAPAGTIANNASSQAGITALSQLTATASKALSTSLTPAPYYITNPVTGQSVLYNPSTGAVAGAGSAATTELESELGGYMPYILIGAVILLMMSESGGKH